MKTRQLNMAYMIGGIRESGKSANYLDLFIAISHFPIAFSWRAFAKGLCWRTPYPDPSSEFRG